MNDHTTTARGHETGAEAEFAGVMASYYRRAGRAAAWTLLSRLEALVGEGASRAEVARVAREALELLPTAH